ncbi:Pimeloyl-ACP methyl ester carboxylesterase [Lutibacter oricola]|uniref:Pimeloyl-ACP methyl ester carboxylesterase n=1 Tax=Lutibacter oricola TaxID=762486 RepID=A0A1H3EUQ0_9FLAO|nr:alpha/beta hydrolase [Lutibacter oricola]SDX81838.1 Pimeloyl-ACP methyl ester carboxylesterase [Lutibacter oricola]
MSTAKSSKKPINNGIQVPKVFIIIGHTLQAISHNWATLYAIRLFKTPFRFKTPERELKMKTSSKISKHLISSLNKEITTYSYGSSKRKILLVHGWSGRGTQLYKIADKLIENDFMTISFDAPAHGNSSGKTTMMPEFVASIIQLEKEFGPFEFAIGHSLGAMAVLNAAKKDLNVQKIISIGSGDIITDIITNFTQKLKLKPIIITKMKEYFFKNFGKDIDTYSASISAKEVKVPTLIIHDTDDKEVSVSCAHNIRQNLQQGEILITNGLGHNRILKDDFVIERIVEFINRDNYHEQL